MKHFHMKNNSTDELIRCFDEMMHFIQQSDNKAVVMFRVHERAIKMLCDHFKEPKEVLLTPIVQSVSDLDHDFRAQNLAAEVCTNKEVIMIVWGNDVPTAE